MTDFKFPPPEKPMPHRPTSGWAVKLILAICLGLALSSVLIRAAAAQSRPVADPPQTWHSVIRDELFDSLQMTSEIAGTWGVSTLTAVELQRAYDTNEIRATKNYGEKLAITGVISQIRMTANGVPVITMYAGSPLKHVTLYIRRTGGADKWAADQNKNDKIQVVCVRSGLVLGSVVANECEDSRIFAAKAATDYLQSLPALARQGNALAIELIKQGAKL